MNMLKRVWNKGKMLVAGAVAAVCTSVAHAQSTLPTTNPLEEDIGETLQGHLETVWVIAGIVATIMIGWALIRVGVRFFKRAG
jgi:type IV secretory pathway VirB2 component (pilin)